MSSGVAMNRKIQRENKNTNMANVTSQNRQGINEHMSRGRTHPRVSLRQQNNSQPNRSPIKHLKGTPAQKNWHLLNIHERRLNRLEAWAEMMMRKSSAPNNAVLNTQEYPLDTIAEQHQQQAANITQRKRKT